MSNVKDIVKLNFNKINSENVVEIAQSMVDNPKAVVYECNRSEERQKFVSGCFFITCAAYGFSLGRYDSSVVSVASVLHWLLFAAVLITNAFRVYYKQQAFYLAVAFRLIYEHNPEATLQNLQQGAVSVKTTDGYNVDDK